MRLLNRGFLNLWVWFFVFIVVGVFGFVSVSFASGEGSAEQVVHDSGFVALTFLWIAIILLIAKVAGFIEKFKQPAVLGELVAGVLIGNLYLFGVDWFEAIKTNEIILFLAELGVVILLFQIGLESNIKQMKAVGLRAFLVAIVGVVVPFVLGTYVVGPWLFPGISQNAYLFLGASLTATSVGITARVFKDLNALKRPEAQIILGAAVIDDVLGLIILAVVSALVTAGAVSVGVISVIVAKAILFLVGSIVIGQFAAPVLCSFFAKIQRGVGMKLTVALSFGLIFAYLAQQLGLAPIVGAFAAGLILDPVFFRDFSDPRIVHDVRDVASLLDESSKRRVNEAIEKHSERHVEDLVEPLAHFLVPIFFVVTGMGVKLETLIDPSVLLVALGIVVVAIAGKIVAGVVAGKGMNKLLVGVGMVPRGEVGLIFASIGLSLGVLTDQLYSVIVIMVILTTLLTPPFLAGYIRKSLA